MLPKLNPNFLAVFLILIFLAQGLYLIQDTSPTTDEIPFHMVNGYAYLKTHDFRMNPSAPPLIREWMALPWLYINPRLDLNKDSWVKAESVDFGVDFFYKDNRNLADLLLYSSRFMVLLLALLLGVIIFSWARKLYGEWGGVLSLAVYTFCPNFLAHSALATVDIGVTLFAVTSGYFLWRYLEHSKKKDLWLTGISLGLACSSKFTGLFFIPIYLFFY